MSTIERLIGLLRRFRWYGRVAKDRLKVEAAVLKLLRQVAALEERVAILERELGHRVYELADSLHEVAQDDELARKLNELKVQSDELDELKRAIEKAEAGGSG